MRRRDREVKDTKRISEILAECKVCRLGLIDNGSVYIVPMNFGAEYQNGNLSLYFHCALKGRRMSILAECPNAGFEMDCAFKLTGEGDLACEYSSSYASIIGTGTVDILEKAEDKIYALKSLMHHQTGREFYFTEEMVERVAVLRLSAIEFSCKEHL